MRKVPEGTTHLDTVDSGCRLRRVTAKRVYAYDGYNWYLIPVPVSEATLDNHYIELAAHYAK